jgi:hypothetical protein
MTKLETLQKAVVDTAAAHDAAYKAWEDAWDTYAARLKAKLELEDYLKEQDDEHSN